MNKDITYDWSHYDWISWPDNQYLVAKAHDYINLVMNDHAHDQIVSSIVLPHCWYVHQLYK